MPSAAAGRKPASTASRGFPWASAAPAPGRRRNACTACWRASLRKTWCWKPTPRTWRRPAIRDSATVRNTCRPSAPPWRAAWGWNPRCWPRPPIATAAHCSAGERRLAETRQKHRQATAGVLMAGCNPPAASDLEGADQLPQPRHRTGQFAAGLLALDGAFGGALAGLADLHDVLVVVMGHGRRLLHGGGDLLVLIDDLAHGGEEVVQCLLHRGGMLDAGIGLPMAGMHVLHCRADPLAQAHDHLLDFRRRLLGALRQAAHLVGHHGEAAALLAGACRLDGGVERQQVGLLGHALDDVEDLADGLAVGGQAVDGGDRLVQAFGQLANLLDLANHQFAADTALAVHALGVAHRGGGVARHLLGGGGHLVHGGGDLIDALALLAHRLAALPGDVLH